MFTSSSIGYVGGPGSGTVMLVVGLLVLAEWRAPNCSVMALKLQHDRFQSVDAGSMRPRLYPGPLRLCSLYHVRQHLPVSVALTSSVVLSPVRLQRIYVPRVKIIIMILLLLLK